MNRKAIPNTLGFQADIDGRIFDQNGRERNYYRNLDGYRTASVKMLDGHWQTFGVHRLVAMAHIEEDDLSKKYVNHKNSIKTDNRVENLEWVSGELNNSHASLNRRDNKRPVILATHSDGRKMLLKNIEHASQWLSEPENVIWEAIKTKSIIHDWKLEHHKRGVEKPPELRKKTNSRIKRDGVNVPIKVKELNTGETKVFSSIRDASMHYNTSPSNVYRAIISIHGMRLFKSRYVVTTLNSDFPDLADNDIVELVNRGPKEVVAYHIQQKRLFVFKSAAEFIRLSGLSKKAVTVSLRKGRLRLVQDWVFLYSDKDAVVKIALFIECPDSINV